MPLLDKAFVDLKPNQLNCKNESLEKYSKHFIEKSDLKIRAIEWSRRRRNSLRIVWLVLNRVEDIASFRVVVANSDKVVVNDTVDYNLREYVANNLNDRQSYVVCVDTNDSDGQQRPHFFSQCIRLDNNHIDVDNFAPQITFDGQQSPRELSISSSADSLDIRSALIALNVYLLIKELLKLHSNE